MPNSSSPGSSPITSMLEEMWASLGGADERLRTVSIEMGPALPSPLPVSDLAGAAIATAGLALAELVESSTGTEQHVHVDRALASAWFGFSLSPQGWELPAAWDPIAGNYRCADGWVRLHTNVPAHRAAALAVLDVQEDPDAVAAAVTHWRGAELEDAVVERGGCAAVMRSRVEWYEHPQGQAVAASPLVDVRHQETAAQLESWTPTAERPLAGIRVLDLTRVLAGPVATRALAGWGATVLRLDPPDWEEPGLIPEVMPGKRSARLDLHGEDGIERLRALLTGADVLVHSLRPGALARLGLGADERASLRPGLVDVSLSAYGTTGPWAGRRGFDSVVQMSSGLSDEGRRLLGGDKPVSLPVQALDHAAGYLIAAAVIRGLTAGVAGRPAWRAGCSLARVARLLSDAPAPADAPDLDLDQVPLGPEIEQTGWGPGRRMVPPLEVGGVAWRWDRGAMPLGSDTASWPD